jgi:hypothetical protein
MKTIRKSLAFIFVEILLSGNSLPAVRRFHSRFCHPFRSCLADKDFGLRQNRENPFGRFFGNIFVF